MQTLPVKLFRCYCCFTFSRPFNKEWSTNTEGANEFASNMQRVYFLWNIPTGQHKCSVHQLNR